MKHVKHLHTSNVRFQCNMSGQRGELAQWRRSCETATTGGARSIQGESARVGASNGMGRRGVGCARRAAQPGASNGAVRGAVRPDRDGHPWRIVRTFF
jgi:hypothetical protein